MITHQKNKIFTALFCHHAKCALEANFRKCSLTPTSVLPDFEPGVPILALSNHTSWWDALMALYLSTYVFKREFYGVFAEEQLKRYGIFRLVGCYSVNRESHTEGRQFIRYTCEVLEGKDRMLWLFPQGELVSSEQPVVLKRGFAQVAVHLKKVQLLKMTVSYDFWFESKPEIVLDLMPLETITQAQGKDFTEGLTERLGSELEARRLEVRRIVKERDAAGLKPLFVRDAGAHPVYDAYRSVKSFFKGEPFRRRHGKD